MIQRTLAIMLALCMVISMLPGAVGKLESAAIEPNARSCTVTL